MHECHFKPQWQYHMKHNIYDSQQAQTQFYSSCVQSPFHADNTIATNSLNQNTWEKHKRRKRDTIIFEFCYLIFWAKTVISDCVLEEIYNGL